MGGLQGPPFCLMQYCDNSSSSAIPRIGTRAVASEFNYIQRQKRDPPLKPGHYHDGLTLAPRQKMDTVSAEDGYRVVLYGSVASLHRYLNALATTRVLIKRESRLRDML